MPQIEWDESFSVNNAELDAQHKEWISIFNKLHTTLLTGKPEELTSASVEALKAMQQYALYHFAFEEGFLRDLDYDDMARHVMLHKKFYDKICDHINEVRSGKVVLNTKLIKLMKSWLLDHILIEDKKYARFAAALNR
jgi:hemerythrin